MSPSLRWLLGIVLVLVLLAAGAGVWVWIKLASLKETLVDDLGAALGAKVQVASLEIDAWNGQIHAAGITLENQRAGAPWDKGSIAQATIRFHLGDILSSKIPLSVDVSAWTLVLRTGAPGAAASDPAPGSSGSPSRVEVTDLTAEQGQVTINLPGDRQITLQNVAFQASNNGAGVWTTQAQAASVSSGSLAADATSVQIRGEPEKVSFSNLRMQVAQGFITGEGEMALSGNHDMKVTLKASGVPLTMLVAVPWQVKLSGLVDGEADYTGDDMAGSATGQIAVNGGKFNVLPWIGKVTALVSLPDITDVEVDKATSDFDWKQGTLHLTNLDVRKNDVVRVGGDVTVDATQQVDGHLKLGLPSTVTAKWPDLQTKIFSDAHDDYNWTDVHVTGTPDHLQEDLTSRLVALGTQEGSSLLNQATQKTMDVLKGFLGN